MKYCEQLHLLGDILNELEMDATIMKTHLKEANKFQFLHNQPENLKANLKLWSEIHCNMRLDAQTLKYN